MVEGKVTVLITDFFTPQQARDYLGVSKMTLWRWTRDGKITCMMLDHAYYHINELERVKALEDGKRR